MFQFTEIVDGIRLIGHNVSITGPSDGFAAATAISNYNSMTGVYDRRRPGSVSYIHKWFNSTCMWSTKELYQSR